ncbi:hypothetical protein [Nonlabens xiamenensis]|uniref:hypothetical protein n=1 Tax=Nonlabens xiamenensis TaxID=2341043 RepID=UPI000F6148C4|nr:hypothetical protein [Nonlabens xiamenensis]
MKKNIYLYLFIFAALIALIVYVNGRKYQEDLEQNVSQLRNELSKSDESRKDLQRQQLEWEQRSTFSLEGNPEAESYFDSLGTSADIVKSLITDELLELNIQTGGNPLIPYVGAGKGYHIIDTQFINHRWVLANFTDGQRWGEILIQYFFDENNELELTEVGTVLYPN